MKRAKREKGLWLAAAVITLITTLVCVPVCAISALKESYVIVGITAAVIIHGCYGIGFYSLSFSRAKAVCRCILAFDEGKRLYSDISICTGYTEKAVRDSLARSIKNGYILNATLGDSGVEM